MIEYAIRWIKLKLNKRHIYTKVFLEGIVNETQVLMFWVL